MFLAVEFSVLVLLEGFDYALISFFESFTVFYYILFIVGRTKLIDKRNDFRFSILCSKNPTMLGYWLYTMCKSQWIQIPEIAFPIIIYLI